MKAKKHIKSAVAVLLGAAVAMSLFCGCSSTKPESIKIGYNTLEGHLVLETAAEETPDETSEATTSEQSDSEEASPELCYDNPVAVPENSSVILTATLEPEGSTAEIIWSCDNEEYATVDESGKLTVKDIEGEVTVTAKTDNDVEATLTVNIETAEEIAAEEAEEQLTETASEAVSQESGQSGNVSAGTVAAAATGSKVTKSGGSTGSGNSTATGGGSSTATTGGGSSAGNNNTPASQPAAEEKYYPTITPAEMEAYAKTYAESIGLVYDPRGNLETWSWSAPSTTYKGMSNEDVISGIYSGISFDKSHGAEEVRCIAEPTGKVDSAGNPQYRIYIVF